MLSGREQANIIVEAVRLGAADYVVKPDESVDMRPVEVQLTEADETAIRKGVSDGDLVVVDGIDKLQPGTKVSVGRADARGGKKAAS